ncbi:hypothetical protein P153DRAFT_428120 [Dothidotthia symphoricarpi CBS 119687]|uniref:F-box domain-containing protein n=1 Tax=Dothidotthia symphoricarpi CBS 119687 TaxID=1392245 RepID=A0A6A6AQV2_9PLEO|nr:uncharacterized protein P153DRAFT_428120 [Dothidotthia symphoricarpi CBS 119687]KAF2134319.1 hypothetical protein P153DRAFT_428120 [Dothidotthia symphoricarpi CBS 119687]
MERLSTLPPELLKNVFAFLRQPKDMKSVCLVNKQCHGLMAPILWETLPSDLQLSTSKTLEALLSPQSNILRYIRRLIFYPGCTEPASVTSIEEPMRDNVLLLLTALPKDRLISFYSHVAISASLLQFVIQTHRQLELISSNVLTQLHLTPWVRQHLGNVRALETYVPLEKEKATISLENLRFLIDNTPKLNTLHISVDQTEDTDTDYADISSISSEISGGSSQPLKLKSLTLEHLDLRSAVALIGRIDILNSLVHLKICDCGNLRLILTSMTTLFSGDNKPALRTLEIYVSGDPRKGKEVVLAMERFLLSFSGLTALFLDMFAIELVSKESIINHAQSLTELGVCSSQAFLPTHHSIADLTAILEACPELTQLALDLSPGYLGAWHELCQDFQLGSSTGYAHVETEMEATLRIIAQHPKLHTLRMLDLAGDTLATEPSADLWNFQGIPSYGQSVATIIMQKFASTIVLYLAQAGSGIKLFAPWPIVPHQPWPEDKNGHQWPRYAYLRGRVTDGQGVEQTVATPLADPLRDMPESSIINRYW